LVLRNVGVEGALPPVSISTLSQTAIQRKLVVNEPGDQYEQEADRVAEQVMRMPDPEVPQAKARLHAALLVQRKCAQCEEEEKLQRKCAKCEEEEKLQRKETLGSSEPGVAPAIVHEVLNSGGKALDSRARTFFESRFGRDFSRVRIYSGGKAAESAMAVNARAYTVGAQIVLGGSEADLQTNNGRRLLAHELTHVIQQGGLKSAAASESWMPPAHRGAHQSAPALQPASSDRLQRKVLNHVVEDFQTGANACLVHIHGEERTALSVARNCEAAGALT
jgi:hypothetical protein